MSDWPRELNETADQYEHAATNVLSLPRKGADAQTHALAIEELKAVLLARDRFVMLRKKWQSTRGAAADELLGRRAK
jgi:hypothetical protein